MATITMGEPDPKLFEIPSGYVERPPDYATTEILRRRGEAMPPENRAVTEKTRKYFDLRRAPTAF
jgi:hypothetical protein